MSLIVRVSSKFSFLNWDLYRNVEFLFRSIFTPSSTSAFVAKEISSFVRRVISWIKAPRVSSLLKTRLGKISFSILGSP